MHLAANANLFENKQSSSPATCPRLGSMVQFLLILSSVGMVQLIGERQLLELQPSACWNDYTGVWILADGSHSYHQIVTALKSASTECTAISIQAWAIRYPCRHKKNNPKLKLKRKRTNPTVGMQATHSSCIGQILCDDTACICSDVALVSGQVMQ